MEFITDQSFVNLLSLPKHFQAPTKVLFYLLSRMVCDAKVIWALTDAPMQFSRGLPDVLHSGVFTSLACGIEPNIPIIFLQNLIYQVCLAGCHRTEDADYFALPGDFIND
jgi:hypothetical protein